VNGVDYGKDLNTEDDDVVAEENSTQQAPLLFVSVVAGSAAEAGEARRSAARLERTGREFQAEWVREQEERRESVAEADDG
jgi:hypothetical protein